MNDARGDVQKSPGLMHGGRGQWGVSSHRRRAARYELRGDYVRADPSPPQQRGSGGTVPFRTAPAMGGIRYKKLVLPRLEVPCLPKLS